jgi:(1->4)-alpha-D-glucan 1-alpha-D-glucosylmutase
MCWRTANLRLMLEFFDIDWRPLKDELYGKVLVPVLHDHYGAVLESGELKLVFREASGEFDVSYREHRFPIGPREYPRILQNARNR